MKFLSIPVFFFAGLAFLQAEDLLPYRFASVVLYQPNKILERRISDPAALSAYIKEVSQVVVQSVHLKENSDLDIVLIIKPGLKSRVWLVSSPADAAFDRAGLTASIETVKAPPVTGPIALALRGQFGTRPASEAQKRSMAPIPAEWTMAAARDRVPLQIPDGILPSIWPDN